MNDEQENVENAGSVCMRSPTQSQLKVLDTFFGNGLSASAKAQLK